MADCLIVGGDSKLSKAIAGRLADRGLDVISTTRRCGEDARPFLDLESLEGLDRLPAAGCIAIVAAESRFDICAAEPERTHKINVSAPQQIAQWAETIGARVLFISSSAVHDGSVAHPAEDAQVSPDSVYGQHKYEAEGLVSGACRDSASLRPAKIIHAGFPLFSNWLAALKAGEEITPFSDYTVAPVYLDVFADAAADLLVARGETGVFQISSQDEVSYADVARWLARKSGSDESHIKPGSALGKIGNSGLGISAPAMVQCSRLEALTGRAMPRWEQTL
ncbi:MAG: sugar nucleotide-binding protein, partial [Pseudomonadota bacterium]